MDVRGLNAMSVLLTINDRNQVMLIYDRKLGFEPAWIEFSHDERGVRIISAEGKEFSAGAVIDKTTWKQVDSVCDALVVRMENQKPAEGFLLPFITQRYEETRSSGGISYVTGWNHKD